MKQVNSFRYWLLATLLICVGMTAKAYDLTVGTSEHGTVKFKVGSATTAVVPPTTANENDKVIIEITPAALGWQVDQVTATAFTSWNTAGARGTMPTDPLPTVKVLKTWTGSGYTYEIEKMPAYNVQIDVTYKTTSMENVTIAAVPDQVYTGFEIKPDLTVTYDGKPLTKGSDYTIKEWKNNINVGTATVTIEGVAANGFVGTKDATFKITPKSINADKITVDAIADQPYTGSQIKPTVTVKDGDRTETLKLGTDYTVSYGENINVATGGKVTITGTGNYKDSREVTFKITKVAPTVTKEPTAKTGLIYNEQDQDLVNDDGEASGGKIQYSTDNGQSWKDEIPTGKNAGDYPIKWRVTGDDNHTNTTPQDLPGKIGKAPIDGLTLNPTSYTYDGQLKKPTETVTAKSKDKDGKEITLTVPQSGYTIAGNTATDGGTYTATVTATATGNFSGSKSAEWTIGKANISDGNRFTASLDPTTYIYDGNPKTPTVTVKDKTTGKNLTLTTDYTVTYSDNINVGKGKVKVTGAGKNYEGTINLEFTISNLAITSVTVKNNSLVFNGKEQTVEIDKVMAGSIKLTTDDYEIVSGQKGTHVGEYTLKVQAKAGSNYAGDATTKWNITPLSIANATVTLNPSEYTYDGNEKKPTATVKVGDITLSSSDFDIAYENNINAGTATAIITGKGDFGESTSKDFTIKPASLTEVTLVSAELTYNATQQTVQVKQVKAGDLVVPAAGYTIKSGTNKGTDVKQYEIVVNGQSNYTGSAKTKWNIVAASIADAEVTLTPTEYIYDGKAKEPTATVKKFGKTLVLGTDYTVTYQNNIQAGTATAIITGKGNYKETTTKDFTIKKSDGTIAVDPTKWETTYGDGPQTQQLTISPTDLQNVQFISGNTEVATVDDKGLVTVTGAGVTTIYALVLGDNNYVSSWALCEVTVKPQEVKDVTVGAADASGIPVITAKNKAGETLSDGTDYEIEYTDLNENAKTADEMRQAPGKYLAVVTFIGNYQGIVKKEITVTEITVDTETLIDGLLNGTIPMGDVTEATKKYDVNNDGKVNVADVQAQMNIELGLNADGSQPGASRATAETATEAVLSVSTSDLGGGVTRYALSLDGDREFSAFMMDVTANGAMQVVDQQAAAADMTLHTGTLQNGTLRLLGIGAEQSGSVVYIDVMGEGSLNIENICFSTQSASAFYARLAGNVTSIDQISAATADGEYYGIGGQRQNELKKGVNIVRQNGKSVKVIRK